MKNISKVVFCIYAMFVLVSCSKIGNSASSSVQYNIVASSVTVLNILNEMDQDIVGRPTTKLEVPSKYSNVTDVGSSFSPDFEKIISLNANLLIGDATFKKNIDPKAKQYGIETFYVDTSSYDKFIQSIIDLGKKLNKSSRAETMVKPLQKYVEDITSKNKDKTPPTVAIVFGSSKSNMLANPDSYIGSLVKALNAKNISENILADGASNTQDNTAHSTSSNGYTNFSLEQVLKQDPDIIIRFSHGNVEETKKAFDQEFSSNPAWNNLRAVKNNKVYDLDPTVFDVSASLKMGKAIEELGKILYGG